MATAFIHINGQSFISRFSPLHRSNHRRPSGSPVRVTMAQNSSYWASINDDIEGHLRRAIPVRKPFSVFEPMHHLTFGAPETTAPALCIAACELVGGRSDQAIAAASALHLMHAASYVHEHIPLTDQPRPKSPPIPGPTFGPNIELLTGDAMIPFGFELLAKSDNLNDDYSDRILLVITEIARAIGSQGVVNGQYIKSQCDESDPSIGKSWSPRIVAEKKGSELHACGAACGAILGGGSEEEIEKLRKYGFYAGTIQKMSKLEGEEVEKNREVMEEMRRLALKELEYFDEEKVEAISSFITA